MWEAARARRVLRARQPDRDHRREPARPARRDDARLGSRLLRRRAPRVRLARDRGRRPRRRGRSTAPTRRPRRRPASRRSIVAKTIKGKGYAEIEDKGGLHGKAWTSRGGHRGARRRSATSRSTSPSRRPASLTHSTPGKPLECRVYEIGAKVATRKAYGDALAALGGADGEVVALDGEVSNSTYAEIFRERPPRPVLRDVHRGAADGRRGRGHAGARLEAVRLHLRGVHLARLRLRAHGGDQPRDAQALRLARRRFDRRGRALADGARGSRDVPGNPRLDRPLPVRRQPDRQARPGHGRHRRDLVPPHDEGGHRRSSTSRTRSSRSEAARPCAPPMTTT